MLRDILGTSACSPHNADGAALAAMFIIGLFTKARCREYLSNGAFDSTTDLTIGDVRFEFAADGAAIRAPPFG